ncbi:MAG: pyridoxal-phosphate dependent enzyme [Cyanobacteria bacterium SZAS TMP-1]|nr:pyridoxal-phosphate dependent enzyme [Cyanobacteria bacterium SZAS TMP-1]
MQANNLQAFELAPIRAAVRRTTIICSRRLDVHLGAPLIIASETFQETGSFKFRAAYAAAHYSRAGHLLTASSGNFGQALALAARLLGKECTVVMPTTSAAVKIEAVKGYGATVDLVDTRSTSRQKRVAELAAQIPGVEVLSAYDDERVIAGNSTLGEELADCQALHHFDCVIAPMGGGGLTAGLVQGLRAKGAQIEVFAAEPQLGNDGARSLAAGRIIANEQEPATIADGARTVSLGQHNFAILKDGLAGVIEVSEEEIKEAVRLLYGMANLKSEPTGALGLGALLSAGEKFAGRRPLIVVSGGNVDSSVYCDIIGAAAKSLS